MSKEPTYDELEKLIQELRESEKKYRNAFDWANDAIILHTLTTASTPGRFIDVNPAACRMLGYSRDELLTMGPPDIVPTELHPMLEELIRQAATKESYIIESRIMRKDGTTFPVESSAHLITYEEKRIWLSHIRDITERKLAEDSLRESEEKYRILVENSVDAVFLAARDGRIFAANNAACDMFGMSEPEIITSGRNGIVDLNDPRLSIALKERARTGKFTGELHFKKKDGTVFAAWVSSTIFMDSHGNERACNVVHDITERKKYEEELFRIQKLESLGLLAGGIAHDFNNFLSVILGYISLAKMAVTPEDEIFNLLDESEKASINAQNLTKQLLTFATGGAPVKEIASIAEIIKEASTFVLRGSKSHCEFLIEDDLWPAEVDAGQINQVINNVVLNASQAMPEGGIIRVTANNLIVGEKSGLPVKTGKYIRISISDHGFGIAEKHLLKIFDPFFTIKQQRNGLGLTTTYSIINKHEGHISVESKLGIGTTFFIYLPASDKKVIKKEELQIKSGHGRILVMDDEATIRKIMGKILKKLNYEPDFAKNGDEAILIYKKAKISRKPFDAVILDLTVSGGMGGKEAIKKLLEIDPEINAIVSSGYSDDAILSDFRTYGFKAALTKPVEIGYLSKVLHELLNSKK
jgi:two-component system, cell cycle sensor histidine kinase and response regulator CckA